KVPCPANGENARLRVLVSNGTAIQALVWKETSGVLHKQECDAATPASHVPLWLTIQELRHYAYALRLKALFALNNLKLDPLPLFQRAVPCCLNCAVMNENITTRVPRDEAITLGRVKPLYGAGFALRHDVTPP